MHLREVRELQETAYYPWRDRLYSLNIRHVEQLGSFLAAPEGRYALEKLGVPVEAVQKAIEPELRGRFGLSLSQPLKKGDNKSSLLTLVRYPMGYDAGDRDPFRHAVFDTALPDPPEPFVTPAPDETDVSPAAIDIPEEMMLGPTEQFRALDQGRRNTCVAFAAMGMYEFMCARERRSPVRLSPQYLYYRAKAEDSFGPDEEGTSLVAALQVLKTEGCCLEQHLTYHPRHDIPQAYRVRGFNVRKPESELRKLARDQQIVGYRAIAPTVDVIRRELADNRPVGVGLAVYVLAWYNSLAKSRGEIALPLMDTTSPQTTILDNYLGGHAVLLVGYRNNSVESGEESHRPGGGHFIFRNSWGEDWAWRNDFGPGYGCLPYEYLSRFCLEATVIDALVPSEDKVGKARSKTAARAVRRSRVASSV